MGREAFCACTWNGTKHQVKVLLEPPELILRGEIRRRIRIEKIESVKAEADNLLISYEGDSIRLNLGESTVAKWAKAILKPPTTLANKLGITANVTVQMIGPEDDPALKSALKEAKFVSQNKGDLILARVNTPSDLSHALRKTASRLTAGIPIWFIYRKGPGHPLNENLVRTAALATGIVDTKIASVSAEFSALRFVKRRS